MADASRAGTNPDLVGGQERHTMVLRHCEGSIQPQSWEFTQYAAFLVLSFDAFIALGQRSPGRPEGSAGPKTFRSYPAITRTGKLTSVPLVADD